MMAKNVNSSNFCTILVVLDPESILTLPDNLFLVEKTLISTLVGHILKLAKN